MLVLSLLAGCGMLTNRASDDSGDCRVLLERAIAARGGALRSFRQSVEAQVYVGFPGTWRLDTAFSIPDHYRWTIHTSRIPDHYVWNGTAMLAYVGGALVAVDDSAQAPLRSHARWTAVAHLDALRLPDQPLHLRCSADTLDATFDDGSVYQLRFDGRDRVTEVRGPVALPPMGSGTMRARFEKFEEMNGFVVPRRASYFFGDQHLYDERLLSFVPNDPTVTPALFDL